MRALDGRTAGSLVKLVIFIVVTSIATAGLAVTIGAPGLGDANEYKAIFSDATGVEQGDDIRIAGVQVGEVRDIKVKGDGSKAVAEVTFTVDDDQRLASTTQAAIRFRNLVGQRYIALTEGAGSPDPLREGGTIPLSRTQPALDLTVLFNGFKPLFAALSPQDVNQLAYEIIQVLQGEAGTVESLLAHTASLTSTLADRDKVIGDLIDNLNVVLGTVSDRDEKLALLISELQRFVSGLSEDRKAIGDSLASIVSLNQQTAGLLEDSRGDLKDDIAQLGKVAGTLDDNSHIVERTLTNMPDKLNAITGTATYGSWFNFYLCDFDGRVVLPNGEELLRPGIHVTAARCQR
jgi:phospholipid/cholesterol/gamma-HCH transport system substrate-binding protein